MILGIIGKVGSGKSALVKYILENYDAIYFSCDDIAKEMIKNGEIDYNIEKPAEFFTNERLQEQCRTIVHKAVFDRIFENINHLRQKNVNKCTFYVIETALPSEDFVKFCDKTIYVYNSYEKKSALLTEYRGYSDMQIKLIYDSQKYYEKFYEMADYKIENNTTVDDLLEKLKEVMDEICITCK